MPELRMCSLAILTCLCAPTPPASANVITDWDETAESLVAALPPFVDQRMMAMVNVAMFDAVNAVERRYAHYLAKLEAAAGASKEAAAVTAAATVLATIDATSADKVRAIAAKYLAS